MNETPKRQSNSVSDPPSRKEKTLGEYLEEAPESKCDLVEGIFVHHSPVDYSHERLRRLLDAILTQFCQINGWGEVFGDRFPLMLTRRRWREPDIFVVETKRLDHLEPTAFKGVPNLIVEIISEDYRYDDEVTKRAEYERLGTNEYWILDPRGKDHSTFLTRKGDRLEGVNFESGIFRSIAIPKFFVREEWLWPIKEFPKISAVLKDLEQCKDFP